MLQLHIGERLITGAGMFVVRSLSPMGTRPRRVQLEDAETGEQFDVPLSDLEPEANDVDSGSPGDQALDEAP